MWSNCDMTFYNITQVLTKSGGYGVGGIFWLTLKSTLDAGVAISHLLYLHTLLDLDTDPLSAEEKSKLFETAGPCQTITSGGAVEI